jgi:uncharacterized protein YjiS (DUF1127 family)
MAYTQTAVSAPSSLFGFIARIRTTLAQRALRRDTIRTLHALSDRELEDIGISRGDIFRIAEETTAHG